ncbi:MAG: pyridoxamine 5'-phosphate oxidase family protein [Salinivirgaceae bacterium]|nr:pyridoxamine 5'-phosphate oxidase family protein [Salinivirgaceae bacterium]
MRKESRQMSAEWALEVLDKAPYVTVSMVDANGLPYSVPLSLARINANTFYFHCATEGKKLDILQANPNVCLSAVSKCKPTVGPKDGSFTLEFKSAIAYGTAQMVTSETEKIEALRCICQRFLPNHMDAFNTSIERSLARTAVVRITLTEPPVGKRKQYDANGDEMKWQRME